MCEESDATVCLCGKICACLVDKCASTECNGREGLGGGNGVRV